MKKKFLFALVLFAKSLFAQEWVEKMADPNANFYDAKASFEAYWSTHDHTEKGKGYKVFKRWENFVGPRVYPSGNLSQLGLTTKNYEAFLKDYQKSSLTKQIGGNNLIASATWTPMGPMGPLAGSAGSQLLKSGRIGFITVTPGNLNTLWVGAPAGGLWKSTNGGVSWTTNTDYLSVIGCSDLAIDPTNTLVMYLATGDGDAGDTRSIGVLKTTNGGATWSATGLTNPVTNNFTIRRLIINPNNTQILLAATSGGIYRTTNGGTNWTQVTTNSTYDLEFKPGNPNIIYSTGTSFRISTNGGASWTQISNGIPTTGCNRMAIAVTPADTNYVYVVASNSSNSGLLGFYSAVTGGTAFTQVPTGTLNLLGYSNLGNDTGGQGWYDLCIAASPLDKNEVVVGGVNVWRTLNGGSSWSIYGHWTGSGAPFTHADQHDLEYDASGTLYNTNDGTVYRRNGSAWTEISGTMNISQIYRIGLSSLTPNKWITGHQDNGTSIWTGTTYSATLGGDGMDCFIDRTNDQNLFAEYQNGGMRRSTNGGSSWSTCTTNLSGTAPWVTIWKQDPVTASRFYVGLQDLFVTNNMAAGWSTLTAIPATGDVREFAIAPSNNQVIYVLKSAGIYKTTNGGSTWTNVTGSVPVGSGAPEYICIDPNDANNAWVVLSGYSSGNHVFVTNNGGTSWTNVTANLPNIPANCIVYEPGSNDMVYVGMDVGVYYRNATSSSWTLYNSNLPNVPISELEITPANPSLIYASTYGRGVWVASLYSTNSVPASNFSVSSAPYCTGSTITFSDLSTNTPTAWLWSSNPSPGVVITSPTSQNPTFTFPAPGVYTISLQANNAFGSGSTYTQVISISTIPVLNMLSPSQTVCPGSPVSYSVSGALSYSWSNSGGTASVSIYYPVSNTVYTVTGNNNGCTSTKTIAAVMLSTPPVAINGPSASCSGDQLTLIASGANTYTWGGGQNTAFLSINPLSTTVYTLSGMGGNGCKASATFTMNVNPLPTISISSNDSIVCFDDEVTLSAGGANTYTWQPGGVSGPTASFIPGSNTSYTCTGMDINGCFNTSVFTLTVELCEAIKQWVTLKEAGFVVFPNPVRNRLNIESLSQVKLPVSIELTDLTGRVVIKQVLHLSDSSHTDEINISTIAAGTYFVKLVSGGKTSNPVKLIKE